MQWCSKTQFHSYPTPRTSSEAVWYVWCFFWTLRGHSIGAVTGIICTVPSTAYTAVLLRASTFKGFRGRSRTQKAKAHCRNAEWWAVSLRSQDRRTEERNRKLSVCDQHDPRKAMLPGLESVSAVHHPSAFPLYLAKHEDRQPIQAVVHGSMTEPSSPTQPGSLLAVQARKSFINFTTNFPLRLGFG